MKKRSIFQQMLISCRVAEHLSELRCKIHRKYWHFVSAREMPYTLAECRMQGIESLDDYIYLMYCLSGFVLKERLSCRNWGDKVEYRGNSFTWSGREERRALKIFDGLHERRYSDVYYGHMTFKPELNAQENGDFLITQSREIFPFQVSEKICARGEKIMRERGTLLIPALFLVQRK